MKYQEPLKVPLLVPAPMTEIKIVAPKMTEEQLKREVLNFCKIKNYEFLRLNHEVGTLVVRATLPQTEPVILKFQHNRLKTNDRDLAEDSDISRPSRLPKQELAREKVLLGRLSDLDFIPRIINPTQYSIPQDYKSCFEIFF